MGCCTFSVDDYGADYRSWEDHPQRKEWEVIQELGQGAFSAVVLARHVETRDMAALKLIFIDNPDVDAETEELLIREGHLLQQFNHPNIVTCKSVFKGPRTHVIVLEVLTGGHVFDKLHGLSNLYSERDVAAVFTQIAEAVAYMHAKGVLHRDIKPENVVFARPPTTNAAIPTVKLIDLGMALPYDPNNLKKGCLGTAGFIAPEIVKGGVHTPAMDVYAMGVLLFVMLVGRKPFNFSDVEKLKYAYMPLQEAPGLKDPRWLDLSPDAKDLLMGMLSCDPKRRLSMVEVMDHDWVVSKGGLVLRPLGHDVALGAATVAALRRLRNLGVGAVALPSVVKATEAAKRNKRESSVKDGSVWKQKQTAEHKAFLEAMGRMKKREASIKGGGALFALARTITARSYQTVHDQSLRSAGPSSHPIAQLDPSIHGGDLSVRGPSRSASIYGSQHGARGAAAAAATAAAGLVGMKRTGTSLLLSDLLPDPDEPGSLSIEHGEAGVNGVGCIPKSRSAEGLMALNQLTEDGASQPHGLQLLRASVRQYMEVAAQNRSVRGPSRAASLHEGASHQPAMYAELSAHPSQKQGLPAGQGHNPTNSTAIKYKSVGTNDSGSANGTDALYPKGYLELYGSSHDSGTTNSTTTNPLGCAPQPSAGGMSSPFMVVNSGPGGAGNLSVPSRDDSFLDSKDRSVHGGMIRGWLTAGSRLGSADTSISSHGGGEFGTYKVVKRDPNNVNNTNNRSEDGSYKAGYSSSYGSQGGFVGGGGMEGRKSEELRRKVHALKPLET